MTSSVMASSNSANSYLACQSSIYPLRDQSKNGGSVSMEELLRNVYFDNSGAEIVQYAGGGSGDGEVNSGGMPLSRQGSFSLPKKVGNKTMEDVWKEIVSGGGGSDQKIRRVEEGRYYNEEISSEEMTLEDFLATMGAVREEDVRIPTQTVGVGQGIFGADQDFNGRFQQQQSQVDGSVVGFGNGVDGVVGGGKRRVVQDEPIDKASQQKQRRMIKNRESAARSRERKQAYTVELETLVTQLEEENELLLGEQADRTKQRFKQIMENVIPVAEKQRPQRILLRRGGSSHW